MSSSLAFIALGRGPKPETQAQTMAMVSRNSLQLSKAEHWIVLHEDVIGVRDGIVRFADY